MISEMLCSEGHGQGLNDLFCLATDALPSEEHVAAIVAAMDSHWLHFTPPQRQRCASALGSIRGARLEFLLTSR